jgi:anaerobic magnesium-protoporphyrin IX monomethyl ester cyclase
MRILLINPPFHSATTSYGLGTQVPLGLALVGGALLEPGHDVWLIDAEARRLSNEDIVKEAMNFRPDVIMTGHAGSTAAHPIAIRMARALKAAFPNTVIVYGGVFPTYHGKDILADSDFSVEASL